MLPATYSVVTAGGRAKESRGRGAIGDGGGRPIGAGCPSAIIIEIPRAVSGVAGCDAHGSG